MLTPNRFDIFTKYNLSEFSVSKTMIIPFIKEPSL